MKRLIPFLFFVFSLSLSLFSQMPSYVYDKRDDAFPYNYDSGIKTYYWNNGVLILGFSVDTLNYDYGTTLIFYDSTGNKLWTKNYRIPNYYVLQGNDIAFVSNENFYVSGVVYQADSLGWDMFFAKFNRQGDSLFFKVFPDTVSKFSLSMAVISPDSILVMSAWQTQSNPGYARICIDRLDTNGNILYNYLGNPDLKFPDQMLITENNLIYIGGTRKTAPGSEYHVKVFINKYDMNLNYLGTINPSYTLNEYFISMMNHCGRVYLTSMISVNVPGYDYPWWQACLSKLHLNGVWANKKFGVPEMENIGIANSIGIDQNYLAIPITEEGQSYLYFCDTNLVEICHTFLTCPNLPPDGYSLASLGNFPGHKISGTGYVFWDDKGSQDHWNFLTQDMVAYLDEYCTIGITPAVEERQSLKIYPNPFDRFLRLEFEPGTDSNTEVTIFNELGSSVYSKKDFKPTDVIETTGFFSGIFIVKIQTGNKVECEKVLKLTCK